MTYTKEEFKRLWDSSPDGGGITNDDCADCAKAWGLCSNPRCMRVDRVVAMVCKAAGVDDKPNKKKKKCSMTSEKAWKVFNFIKAYQNGDFGFVTLQQALDEHFDTWQQPRPLREQTGDMI